MSAKIRWNSPSLPPVTKHLIIINAILWVTTMLLKSRGVDLSLYLGLHFWKGNTFHFHQFLTHMFMHDSSAFNSGFTHIFCNMFTLWMFGSLLENVMGTKRFILFYLICGLGAGLVQEIVWQIESGFYGDPVTLVNDFGEEIKIPKIEFFDILYSVGASGAVFGLLLAFAMLFPNIPVYIMFIPIPVKAKYAVIGFAVIELFFGVAGVMSSVAHYAHLGGMLFGLILILYWKKKGIFNNYYVYR
ncbi:MAG: rhomboid family intramembrane serine protease [Muribaculaceae bacterium]|nr:rhomboid family intramembrane serine protease [Muribaculaceae bacterium]